MLTCPAVWHVGAPQLAPSLYAARASPGPTPLCSPSLVGVTLLHTSPEGREAGGAGLAPTSRGFGLLSWLFTNQEAHGNQLSSFREPDAKAA